MTFAKQSRRAFAMAVALGGSVVFASHSQAAIITPGGPALSTPGTATFSGLTRIADETFTVTGYDISNVARYTATVESSVYKEPTGTLDFAYKVINLVEPNENDALHTVSVSNFRTFTTDVDYVSGTGNVAFDNVSRSIVGIPVSFDYTQSANQISPGQSTDWMLIKTNATVYDNNGQTNLIDGTTAVTKSFEPAVPEPISLGMLIPAAALLMRRKK